MTAERPLGFPYRIPFVEELGLELWAFGAGQAELRVDLAQAHLNSLDVAHGVQDDDALAGVLCQSQDQAFEAAAGVGVFGREPKPGLQRAQLLVEAGLQVFHRAQHPTAKADAQHRVLDRPIPVVLGVQALEQRLIAF